MELLFLSLVIVLILAASLVWTIPRGAPWVPTPMSLVQDMLDLVELKPDELVYDLGCGDGRFLIAAARDFNARAVGIELDPLRWLFCQLRIRALGFQERVQVLYGDFFTFDLEAADVVVCYLLPASMKELQEKLLQELRPGTRVVSNTFLFPGLKESGVKGKARLYHFSPENTQAAFIKQQLSAADNQLAEDS